MFRTTVAACVAAGAMMAAGPASAATLFDSGVPSADGGGPLVGAIQSIGGRLLFGADVAITEIQYFLGVISSGPLRFSVRAEGLNDLPGAVLQSVDITAAANSRQWISSGALNWNLGAGAFWFTIEADSPFDGYLPQQPANSLARYAFSNAGGWQQGGVTPYGFRVFGEGGAPVSLGDPWRNAAVPEPATWALMIVGFGGAGAMIRRRRVALA